MKIKSKQIETPEINKQRFSVYVEKDKVDTRLFDLLGFEDTEDAKKIAMAYGVYSVGLDDIYRELKICQFEQKRLKKYAFFCK